ncbi:hATC-domain-containing protein [Auricularia subglabra TFB-10046 SS5]|nr:hATC-domain-containing protein [Auricularia subglabra TFB-10046 SS5]
MASSSALEFTADDCNARLKSAIIDAFRKLSDYYWKFNNESPFYLWAALLDPRIMVEGLQDDCTNEPGMTVFDLQDSKDNLRRYFDENYPAHTTAGPATPASSTHHKFGFTDFTARYAMKSRKGLDELEEYWRQTQEPWDADPIQWWVSRRTLFPRLSRMALDILSIPGSAVAVERVFSGGRDTVSMRRARLSAETIRVLMLVKQSLRQARDVLGIL